jgi:hypothetical protein
VDKITRSDLMSLEAYHKERPEFRARVLAHKQDRQLAIGPNATLYFEDRLTIQYQVQEMLRIERIFEAEGIDDELSAYNPLIPDGSNFKATFMLEFPDVAERRAALAELGGIERHVYCQVGNLEPVYAVADEDLDRTTEEKTSAVHFLRFELDAQSRSALKGGEALTFGIDHPSYGHRLSPIPDATRDSLLADLD